jgi:hypothetical protein
MKSGGRRLTDREMLVRLLLYAVLSPAQRSVLENWYDDLTRGTLAELPSLSRLWVEAFYQEERIDDRRAEARRKTRGTEQTKNGVAPHRVGEEASLKVTRHPS